MSYDFSRCVLCASLKGFPCSVVGKEAWNYVKVRDGAHMFWWLYYADSQSAEFKDLPLVMWLQVGTFVMAHLAPDFSPKCDSFTTPALNRDEC